MKLFKLEIIKKSKWWIQSDFKNINSLFSSSLQFILLYCLFSITEYKVCSMLLNLHHSKTNVFLTPQIYRLLSYFITCSITLQHKANDCFLKENFQFAKSFSVMYNKFRIWQVFLYTNPISVFFFIWQFP